MKFESFDDLADEVYNNDVALAAALENDIRRNLGRFFMYRLVKHGLTINGLAENIGCTYEEAQYLLHEKQGGDLKLNTICKALVFFNKELVKAFMKG